MLISTPGRRSHRAFRPWNHARHPGKRMRTPFSISPEIWSRYILEWKKCNVNFVYICLHLCKKRENIHASICLNTCLEEYAKTTLGVCERTLGVWGQRWETSRHPHAPTVNSDRHELLTAKIKYKQREYSLPCAFPQGSFSSKIIQSKIAGQLLTQRGYFLQVHTCRHSVACLQLLCWVQREESIFCLPLH